MSINVALKFNNGVILASDKQLTYNGHICCNTGCKISKSKYSNTAIGSCGNKRSIDIVICYIEDLMNYKDILDNVEFDFKYVVTNVVTNLFDLLDRYGNLYKQDNVIYSSNEFITISGNKIFTISGDGSVLEFDNYGCIGSGCDLVRGYLDNLSIDTSKLNEHDAFVHIQNCINKCCKNDIYIDNNIDYIILYNK